MNFDSANITVVTFYGHFTDGQPLGPHAQIPIDPSVQEELKQMLQATLRNLGFVLNQPAPQLQVFDPAEKYSAQEALQLPLATPFMADLVAVMALANLPSGAQALANVQSMDYYYAVFQDAQGRNLYAFRRAARFKGVARSKLTYVNGGLLTLVEANIFRLDSDFDYLVDAQTIFISHVQGFEYTTNAHQQIVQSAAANATAIGAQIPFLDMTGITTYALGHSRAARLLAAIRHRADLPQIDRGLLAAACRGWNVNCTPGPQNTIGPAAGHEYDFLLIIDRRVFVANLIQNVSEKYEAASRFSR